MGFPPGGSGRWTCIDIGDRQHKRRNNTQNNTKTMQNNRIDKIENKNKAKVIPRQAEVAQRIPGRLRPRIFSTFGTTSVIGRQPNAPAAFTPGEILGTHFQRLSRPQGTWFCRKEPQKKIPSDTTGNRPRDRLTSSAAP